MSQAYEMYKGEDRTFEFYARETDSTPIDLTGAVVELIVPLATNSSLNLSGSVVAAESGAFTVSFSDSLDLLVGQNIPLECTITIGGNVRIVSIIDGLSVLKKAY